MAREEFEIYQTATGYTAVTNPTRRRILEALAEGEKELPALVEITGKAKPTLSNLHMRELLDQSLIEERPHPTDARRKIFSLKSRRIGASSVPIDQLRGAVRKYVTSSPMLFTLPLSTVFGVLLAPPGIPREALRVQGRALGQASAHVFSASVSRDLVTAVAAFWEREGVARVGKIDLDRMELEVDVVDRLAGSRSEVEAVASLLGGFLEGVWQARIGASAAVSSRASQGTRITVALPRRAA